MTSQFVSHHSVRGIAWQDIADSVYVLSTTKEPTDLMTLGRIMFVFYNGIQLTYVG